MNFIDKIVKLCAINTDKIDSKSEYYNKSTFLNYYSITSLVLLLIFSVVSIVEKNTILLISLVIGFIATAINYIIFKRKSNYLFSSNTFSVILTLFFAWLLYSGNVKNQGVIFYSIYPIIAIHLLGKKRGNPSSLVFFVLSGIAILFPSIFTFSLEFSLSTQILFVLLYVIFFVFLNIFENLINIKIDEINMETKEAKQETLAKEDFIHKISHQIRTPLNNIVVVSNMLNNLEIDEKQKDLIDTIQASTNNLVNVVNNIAEISNVDILQGKDYNQNFNINTTVKNTINLFANGEANNIHFPLTISEDINYQLYGDPVKIKQVFLNLIENTLKNSKSGIKTIAIDIKKQSESKEISDILFKISTKDLNNIPEVTRIRNTEKSIKGKNTAFIKLLDFNIANRIIESLGGKIEIDITPEFFEFVFILKFKKGESLIDELKAPKESAFPEIEPALKINLKDATVLLVEDNLINQKIVLLSLKKSVKSVEVANNGKEALDKFGTAKYDIILMDIQMPIMNGIVATKKIRSIEKSTNTHTPIIAITANALLGDKEECIAAGMDDYISKPFQIETLISKMENQLS